MQIEQGLKLYNQHKQQQAVRKWKSALKAIRKREDKFEVLGYLYQAYMDWGKYRSEFKPLPFCDRFHPHKFIERDGISGIILVKLTERIVNIHQCKP